MQNVLFFFQQTDLILDTLIDKIILYFDNSNKSFIENLVSMADKKKKHHVLQTGYYDHKYLLKINGFHVTLFSKFNDSNLKIILFQPNISIQNQLNEIFIKFGIIPKLSEIEFSWDFYCPSILDQGYQQSFSLQNQLIKYGIHPYQRKESRKIKNDDNEYITKYSSFGRKVGRSIKIYIRPFPDEKNCKGLLPFYFVRTELTLKRPIIKNLGLSFPLYAQDIQNINFRKFIQFGRFNYGKFRKFILKLIMRKDKRKLQIEKYSGKTIEDFCNWIEEMDLIELIEFFKKSKSNIQYGRFIVLMEEENDVFYQAWENKQGFDC